ncbi:MAG: hypothetical protein LBI62_03710 [Candidatus Accumulibacter sp.]|nr:hypothetical protein [Accumulibacter sp.]
MASLEIADSGLEHQNRHRARTKKAFQIAGCRGIIFLPGAFEGAAPSRGFCFSEESVGFAAATGALLLNSHGSFYHPRG